MRSGGTNLGELSVRPVRRGGLGLARCRPEAQWLTLPSPLRHVGISRDNWHKRRKTGGKRKPYHKKRKYELGRPAANTKVRAERSRPPSLRRGLASACGGSIFAGLCDLSRGLGGLLTFTCWLRLKRLHGDRCCVLGLKGHLEGMGSSNDSQKPSIFVE